MESIKLKAKLVRFGRKANDAVSVTFETEAEQVSNEIFANIDKWYKQSGYLLFQDGELAADIPHPKRKPGEKSFSQRYRNQMYLFHTAQGGKQDSFPKFYRAQMKMLLDNLEEETKKIKKDKEAKPPVQESPEEGF